MKSKAEAHHALSTLFARDGVPISIVMDGAREQTMGEFRRKAKEAGCRVKETEPHTPWSNAAEGIIRELKKGTMRKMIKSRCPKTLWDDCMELESMIRSHTAKHSFGLQGETPETRVLGVTPDISAFAEFGWYQWVMFRDTSVTYPEDNEVLGRYLGPSFDIGPAMTAKILKANGQVVHRSTLRGLTEEELLSDEHKKLREEYDKGINVKLGERIKENEIPEEYDTPSFEAYEDDVDPLQDYSPDREDVDVDAYDRYLNAEVLLPKGDKMVTATVKQRKLNEDGQYIGKANANPILDTRVYEVQFPDGSEAAYSANVIAENMYAQCDSEGNQYLLLNSIVDHKRQKSAVHLRDSYVTVRGRKSQRKTTKGWKLCVEWKDGTTTWERLADLKESNPVEVAEYAVAQSIDHEPAFAWWVPYTLKRRERIIKAVNTRYLKRTHKFGIRLPKTVKEALDIDRENGNKLWEESMQKEMNAIRVAFKILAKDEKVPPGYQYVPCKMIFDVKMEDLRRKSRYVAQGCVTEAPSTITYASVVSRESVRIALTVAALNDLEVKAGDIQNAYLTAPNAEKTWTTCGPEFGADEGKKALIVRAVYGHKSAGAAFRNHLAECMTTLGYKSCLADQDVWYKAMTRPEDKFHYYSYILLYVDDVLCVNHDAERELLKIDKFFKMKDKSIGDPDIYLGGKLRQATLPNGVTAWGMSSSKYVKEAIDNVEKYLSKNRPDLKLPKKAATPFVSDYRPELDVTPELNAEDANFYQSQVGIARWMVELGRIDAITEISMLASHLALPREGHLEALLRVMGYMKAKHNARMIFDPTYPEIDYGDFKSHDWTNFYGDVKEPIPPNAPKAVGEPSCPKALR